MTIAKRPFKALHHYKPKVTQLTHWKQFQRMVESFKKSYYKNDDFVEINCTENWITIACNLDESRELKSYLEVNKSGDSFEIYFDLYSNRRKLRSKLSKNALETYELDDLHNEFTALKSTAQFKRILNQFKLEIDALLQIYFDLEEQQNDNYIPDYKDNPREYLKLRLGVVDV